MIGGDDELSTLMADFERMYIEEYYSEYKRNYMILSREQQLCNPLNERHQSDGEKRLVMFSTILATGFLWRPHRFQQLFQREVVKALAPLLVGPDWENIGARIIKERNWSHMTRMVMAKAPRRFGKSVAVGMVVIALAETLPTSTQAIFSTGRRASKNLLEICHKMAIERGLGASITRYNQEELFIKNAATGEVARIFSYPANAKISNDACGFVRVSYKPMCFVCVYCFSWNGSYVFCVRALISSRFCCCCCVSMQ